MGASLLKIGTRGSRLALAQANQVADHLRALWSELTVELVIIQTTGDRVLDSPLSKIGGRGLFTKEIEEALLDCRIDLAVHSLKDLPTVNPDGLTLGVITKRENPADLLLSREALDLNNLPKGMVIGTSSLRRRAQLAHLNPDVEICELRGNVPTRIRKMLDGQYDAILLAAAGVNRLGESAPVMTELAPDQFLPAPAQGALGLQIRQGDEQTAKLLAPLHHGETAVCCIAERALLRGLEGGCQLPLGALATLTEGQLTLKGRVLSLDGSQMVEDQCSGISEDAEALGAQLAEMLLAKGAREILSELSINIEDGFNQAVAAAKALDELPLGGKTVLVTRDEDADGPLSMALRDLGASPVCIPLLRHQAVEDKSELQQAWKRFLERRFPDRQSWLVVTSVRTVDVLQNIKIDLSQFPGRIAAVGKVTARALKKAGRAPDLIASGGTAESMLEELIELGVSAGDQFLYPCSDKTKPALKEGLIALGAEVDQLVAYETKPQDAKVALQGLFRSQVPSAVTFCSASAVEAWVQCLGREAARAYAKQTTVVSIGPRTSEELERCGIPPTLEATNRTFIGIAEILME